MDLHIPFPTAVRQYMDTDETLWARMVSFIISPPIVWGVWAYPVALHFASTPTRGIISASIFTGLICILPLILVAYRVKIGKIGDLHMRESNERYIPLGTAVFCSMIAWFLLNRFGSHPIMPLMAIIGGLQLFLVLVATFFNHVSVHAMAITSVTTATSFVFGFGVSLYLVPMILLVALARLVLNRHTPAQILAGTLIGVLTPIAVIAVSPLFA